MKPKSCHTNNGNDDDDNAGDPPGEGGLYVCAVQPILRPPDVTCLDAALRVQRQMATIQDAQRLTTTTVDLFVLPELCPFGYSDDTFLNHLPNTKERRRMVRLVNDSMSKAAVELQTCICYGTIGILDDVDGADVDDDDDGDANNINNNKFTIRQVVVDRNGQVMASYDKMYLCDYGDCAETRFFQPGQALCSFTVQSSLSSTSMRFGLMICADMRYPLLARALTVGAPSSSSSPTASDNDYNDGGGVDAILQPSAFARDLSFRTWTSFRETRAVENAVYWVAVNYAGDSFGHSSILPPWIDEDHEPQVLGTECAYLVEFLSHATLRAARSTMPFYRTMQREEAEGRRIWNVSS
jgi:predicted amidohydrolase